MYKIGILFQNRDFEHDVYELIKAFYPGNEIISLYEEDGADYDIIGRIIINSLGNVGGIVCDGAKSSCAAKIASAVEAGLLAYEMAKNGRTFAFGEGLVEGDYEQTIRNIGRMGREGMKATDEEILHIMIGA